MKVTDFTSTASEPLLFPHLVDFNSVCTTEFVEFSKRHDYGMVHETVSDTAAAQAVFVIDPENAKRAIIYYPMSIVDENRAHIVDALQTADATACSTLAKLAAGDKVIVPALATQVDAEKRNVSLRVATSK